MSLVYLTDRGGKTMKLKELNGRLYPDDNTDSLKFVTEVEARTDDILLLTFCKAGTHWTFEIIRFLLSGTTDLPTEEKDLYFLEKVDRAFIDGLPLHTPRNLNTHFYPEDLSPDFLRKKCKFIYVARDPRDIATSFYNHHKKLPIFNYDGEWEDFFPLFLEGKLDYGSWFEYTKDWEKFAKDHPEHPYLFLTYEGMKADPYGNVKRIDDFIGTGRSEEFLKEVVVKTHFDTMAKIRYQENGNTAFNSAMYRKGIVGDWRNKFTVAQAEKFNEVFEKEMLGTEAYKLYSHTIQNTTDDYMNNVNRL